MTVWVVRAGRYGQREDFALEKNVVLIGWDELPDLSQLEWDDLKDLLSENYPEENARTIGKWAGQAWNFTNEIHKEDLAVLPLKSTSTIAIGEVKGDYEYIESNPEGAKHTIPVRWIETEIPRARFDDDILASFGAYLTVYQPRADDVESRIRRQLNGTESGDDEEEPTDGQGQAEFAGIETQANDQIRKHIDRRFRSHNFAYLVAALLQAKGYRVHPSDPGPDGGVDIIAGKGPMGLDSPRLVVQVKSGLVTADINMVRELNGIIEKFGAEYGLFVSWGGFERTVLREIPKRFFKVRLWDSNDVIAELQKNYESLPEEYQTALPLKRVWALAVEE